MNERKRPEIGAWVTDVEMREDMKANPRARYSPGVAAAYYCRQTDHTPTGEEFDRAVRESAHAWTLLRQREDKIRDLEAQLAEARAAVDLSIARDVDRRKTIASLVAEAGVAEDANFSWSQTSAAQDKTIARQEAQLAAADSTIKSLRGDRAGQEITRANLWNTVQDLRKELACSQQKSKELASDLAATDKREGWTAYHGALNTLDDLAESLRRAKAALVLHSKG